MSYLFFPENSGRSFIQVPSFNMEVLVQESFRSGLNDAVSDLVGYAKGYIDMLPVKGVVICQGSKVEVCDNVVPA